jgi:hypothetical protein
MGSLPPHEVTLSSNMDLNSLLNKLQSAVVAIQAGVASVSIIQDTSDLATVMGPAARAAGVLVPSVLQARIADDPAMTDALLGIANKQQSKLRKATRILMDTYAKEICEAVVNYAARHVLGEVSMPTRDALKTVAAQVKTTLNIHGEIGTLAARLDTKSINASAAGLIESEYSANKEFVVKFSNKIKTYENQVESMTGLIDDNMIKTLEIGVRPDDLTSLRLTIKALQDSRETISTEKKYAERSVVSHFDGGCTDQRAGIKLSLTELVVPSNLSKGRGVEFIKAFRSFIKSRSPWYYAILPELIRILDISRIGGHYLPPSKVDDYSSVDSAYRSVYALQATDLYNYLDLKVSKEIMANIHKPFKYGMEDAKASSENGDGPMALFCILAMYRPSGETYRDEIKEKICALPAKFAEGTNPSQRVNDSLSVLQEAVDLDVKIPWNRTGKLIVSLLSERSNIFSRMLGPYAHTGAILDKEDSAVELKRMFADIVEACKELQESGQDVKRLMSVDFKSPGKGAAKTTTPNEATGDDSNPCYFKENCTRKGCTYGHSKEENAKRFKSKRGKGGKGDKNPKTKKDEPTSKFAKKGKGNRLECQAKSCKAPSMGFRFCTKCHRQALENNGAITLKDGSTAEVKVSKSSAQEVRIAQLEKLLAKSEDTSDGEEEQEADQASKKRKRASAARVAGQSIMDRLGLSNKRHQQ